jgi:A/G-specific adenine glycosylase
VTSKAMDAGAIDRFQKTLREYYEQYGRHDLPWRQPLANGQFDAYAIVVSELMLQQTQVPRVLPKFHMFLQTFPSFEALAAAPLGDVLRAWSGLGYNRRAKFLWQTAGIVAREYNGRLPESREKLVQLPGIGENTAGAILAYAFNQAAVFIETNIRSVFIHHFFAGETAVSDKAIIACLAQILATTDNPRTWYWALMDYGTHLKQTVGNTARASSAYTQQSPFQGSRRQIRGQVLRLLGQESYRKTQLAELVADERLASVLEDLLGEGLIQKTGTKYSLA